MQSIIVRVTLAGVVLVSFAAHPVGAQRRGAPPAPLTLQVVLDAATRQHPLVEAARARVEAARGARRTAGLLPNPVLGYQAENLPVPGGSSPVGIERETSELVTLPLEPLFQRRPRVRQADETVRAREAELVMARRLVALDAARAFYRLAQAQVAVDAATDIEAGLEELVRYHQTRFAEGAVAEGDLIRVQVERERAATSATLARVERVRARAQLAPYLDGPAGGLALDSVHVALTDDFPEAAPLPRLAVLLDSARAARPDLAAARAREAAARAGTSLQRALTLRQLGATVGAKQIGDRNTAVIGLSLPVPLFDRNQGEVQRARAERTAASEELRWAEQQADAEVEAAYESARLLREQAARLRGGFLPRAEEMRRIALAAYQEGGIPLLQVLDATRALADARESYYRALFTARQSLLELNVAAGREPTAPFIFGETISAAPTSQESGVRP